MPEAFAQAYARNATIQAGDAQLRAAGFGVESAKSGYKPQISFEAGIGTAHNDVASPLFPISTYPMNTRTAGVVITQPLYSGGQTAFGVNAARATESAERAQLNATEEQVFLKVVRSFGDVVRDRAVLALEQNNLDVLDKQLQETQAELQNGEVTHTDLAQAEARLAAAQASLIQAQGSLTESRAAYLRTVGVEPQGLEQPPLPASLPGSEEQAVQLSAQNFPVLAARYLQNAAEQDVQMTNAKRRPQIALTGQLLEARDPEIGFSRIDTRSIMLTLSVPIYSGGALSAEKHAAEQRAAARYDELTDVQREARLEAVNAWQALQTANARLSAIQSEVQAEQIAARGVRAEQEVGKRTTLDVLNADQELLNARVDLIRAQRNQLVAAYALQAATGQLTRNALDFQSESDGQSRTQDQTGGWHR
ncbi:MAG: TolC family outer membrane protein [Gammaproteobacteria bacterium]